MTARGKRARRLVLPLLLILLALVGSAVLRWTESDPRTDPDLDAALDTDTASVPASDTDTASDPASVPDTVPDTVPVPVPTPAPTSTQGTDTDWDSVSRLVPVPARAVRMALPLPNATRFGYCDNGHATLDPCFFGSLSTDPAHDERLLVALLEPLTVIDPLRRKASPASAQSWSASEDGRTWTFLLRTDAVWQDGTRVTASHFVESWRRVLDPFRDSPWAHLFRPIAGTAAIFDNARTARALGDLRSKLKSLKSEHPSGIPGKELNCALDDLGSRPFLRGTKSRAVVRLTKWSDDEVFAIPMVDTAMDALKKTRRAVKRALEDAIDAFGTAKGGVFAPDDHTLVIRTNGVHRYPPELVARGAFCPMHPDYERHRDKLFSRAQYFQSYTASRVLLLQFRCDRSPFDNRDARIAFARSIDRAKTGAELWPTPIATQRLVPSGIPGRNDTLRMAPVSVEAAAKSFERSGIHDDTWIELSFSDQVGHLEVADHLIATWNERIGFCPGSRIEEKRMLARTRRSGRYTMMLAEARGFADDPYGYLAGFHSRDPDGGLGWNDKTFDLLLDAARGRRMPGFVGALHTARVK